jgi:hypothetical protein
VGGLGALVVPPLLAAFVAAPTTTSTSTLEHQISAEQRAEERRREAELFGPASEVEPPRTSTGTVSPPAPARVDPEQSPRRLPIVAGDEVYLSQRAGAGLLDRLRGRLEDREDVVTIGGQLLLQLQYNMLEQGAADEFALRSPNFFDLFVDVRPSERIRAFAQGRLQHDFTLGADGPLVDGGTLAAQNLPEFVPEETRVLLDQLWLKFDAWRRVFFTVGRQRLRWGSGRFFNPTDFVNRQRQNPLALFDQRLGVGLIKVHVPFEREGANLYVLADLDDAPTLGQVGGAVRGEVILGPAETALTVAYRDGSGLRGGVDVSAGLWRFDVRGEFSTTWGDEAAFFAGELDLSNPASPALPTRVDRSDELLIEAMVGADTTFKLAEAGDQLIVGFEYYYNQRGYPNADLYPFLIVAPLVDQAAIDAGQEPPFGGVAATFNPFLIGRHYVAAFASLLGPGRWDDSTFSMSTVGNLSDRSFIVRFDFAQVILTYLSLRAFVNAYVGESGVFKLGFEVPAGLVPGAPEDADTFSVIPPLIDVGLALTLDF